MIPQATELNRLLGRARARVAAMTPGELAKMHEAQRRSYVRGELMMERPEMTAEEADFLIDHADCVQEAPMTRDASALAWAFAPIIAAIGFAVAFLMWGWQ